MFAEKQLTVNFQMSRRNAFQRKNLGILFLWKGKNIFSIIEFLNTITQSRESITTFHLSVIRIDISVIRIDIQVIRIDISVIRIDISVI